MYNSTFVSPCMIIVWKTKTFCMIIVREAETFVSPCMITESEDLKCVTILLSLPV